MGFPAHSFIMKYEATKTKQKLSVANGIWRLNLQTEGEDMYDKRFDVLTPNLTVELADVYKNQ